MPRSLYVADCDSSGGRWSWRRGWGSGWWRRGQPRWRRWARTPRPRPYSDTRRPGPGCPRCQHWGTGDLKKRKKICISVFYILTNFLPSEHLLPQNVLATFGARSSDSKWALLQKAKVRMDKMRTVFGIIFWLSELLKFWCYGWRREDVGTWVIRKQQVMVSLIPNNA